MKKIKKFIIEGKNFHDEDGFYDEFERVFLKDFPKSFKFGRNLDAFDDILYPDEEEKKYKWVVVWENFDKSERELPTERLIHILEILHNHKNKKHLTLTLKRKSAQKSK